MNPSPFNIALRNMIASQFGVTDLPVLNLIVDAAPTEAVTQLQKMLDGMLTGPAGDLTSTLEATAADDDDCHCLRGYAGALTDIIEARAIPSPAMPAEYREGFTAGFDCLQSVAAQMKDHIEMTGTLPPRGEMPSAGEAVDLAQLLATLFAGVTPAR